MPMRLTQLAQWMWRGNWSARGTTAGKQNRQLPVLLT